MPGVLDRWTVKPHGPLEAIDPGVLTVVGDIAMPLGRFPRRMVVVALADGSTIIWSAIALGEPDMARIEALGRPGFLIVPNGLHRMDARIWKQRYPDIRVITPPGAAARVGEVVPVDGTEALWNDPTVRFVVMPGTETQESALTIDRGGGTTLVVNDLIGNVRHPRGIGAYLMTWLSQFGLSGPRVPWPVARKLVRDRAALAGQFRQWANHPALRRILVSHGDPIEQDPTGILRQLAEQLSR